MRIAFVVISLLLTHSSYGQTKTGKELGRYRAYKYDTGKRVTNDDDSLKTCDLLIKINEYRVIVYASDKVSFDIISKTDSKQIKVGYNNSIIVNLYKALDQDGTECNLKLNYWNADLDSIIIEYPEFTAKYLVNKITEP